MKNNQIKEFETLITPIGVSDPKKCLDVLKATSTFLEELRLRQNRHIEFFEKSNNN